LGIPLKVYGEFNLSGQAHYHPTNKSGSLSLSLGCGFTANADVTIGFSFLSYTWDLGQFINWYQNIYTWNWPSQAGLGEPGAVGSLTANANVNGSVTLNWSASASATGYYIYRGTNSGVYPDTIYIPGGTTTSYQDCQSNGSKKWYYRVAGVNSAETGAQSSEVSATPDAPLTPAGLSITTNANGSIGLMWTVNGAIGYNVYRVSNNFTNSYRVNSAAAFQDTDVRTNTSYSYSVSALNYQGESAKSGAVSDYPAQPGIVASNWILNVSTSGIALAWSSVPGAQDYFVYASTNANAALSNCRVLTASQTAITDTVMIQGSTNYYWIAVSNLISLGAFSTNILSQAVPNILCGLSTTYLIGSNVTLTGTASFGSNSAANTVWVSVNGSAFQQAAITGSTTSNTLWSYNAFLSIGTNNLIRYFAMDANNNCGSTNSSTLVDYSGGIFKIVITGTSVGGGGGDTISWNSIDINDNVGSQDLVGNPIAVNLFAINSTDPTTSPYVFSGGTPITTGGYFVLQGLPGGENSNPLTRTFWFYDQYGNCFCSNSVTGSDSSGSSDILYQGPSDTSGYTIFYFDGTNVSVVPYVGRLITKIVITGSSVGGGGGDTISWNSIDTNGNMGSQDLVGNPIAVNLFAINSTDPTTSPYVFSGGTLIGAGTNFVLHGLPGGENSNPVTRTFWFYDQTGNCFSTNSVTGSDSSGSSDILYQGTSDSTGYTLFTFDGNTVQTSQQ
jgi:hypothetical protein